MVIDTEKETQVLLGDLYDESDSDSLYHFPAILPEPNRFERREIDFFSTFNRGVMLVSGPPGSGKDLWSTTFSYLNKRYWGRPVLLDFKPKRLFGEYIPFDPMVMVQEIDKMAKLANMGVNSETASLTDRQEKSRLEASDAWIDEHKVLLEGAVLYLSELRRYCYNRNPNSRVNKDIGALLTQWRHLDMLVIGTHTLVDEIDYKNFLKKVTCWVKCEWASPPRFHTTDVTIQRDVVMSEFGNYSARLKPVILSVNGGDPKRFLSKPETIYSKTALGERAIMKGDTLGQAEYLALGYLVKMGRKSGRQIADWFRIKEEEVVEIMMSLVGRGYAKGNRFYDLWPTKNKVNLKPAIRMEV